MRRKLCLITLTAMLCALLSGCLPWSAEDSYKLPRPPQEYESLMKAVAQTKWELSVEHSTTVEDVPPSSGDNTSTVQLLDMDEDGSLETAVTFFRIVGAEMPVRIYFYTLQEDDRYVVSGVIQGEGDSVYAVHYADMDGAQDPQTGKRCKEIVVSWQMGSDANYLGVYALEAGQIQAQSRAVSTYAAYQLTDLDRDGLMELAIGSIDREQNLGRVELYDWNAMGVATVSQVALSSGMTAIGQMRTNYLADMVPALYISGDLPDAVKSVEVVAIRDGVLTNLSLDGETGVSREVTAPHREVSISDVNSDYIYEVGRTRVPNTHAGETGTRLVDWVQYNGAGRVKNIGTTYHNVADGWYLVIPDHWQDRLIIYRNDSVSGQRAVIFALWQGEGKEPLPFLSIYKLTGASRSMRATSGNRFILAEDSNTIYAATFYNTWDCGLDQNGLLENFRLIVSSWSGN